MILTELGTGPEDALEQVKEMGPRTRGSGDDVGQEQGPSARQQGRGEEGTTGEGGRGL